MARLPAVRIVCGLMVVFGILGTPTHRAVALPLNALEMGPGLPGEGCFLGQAAGSATACDSVPMDEPGQRRIAIWRLPPPPTASFADERESIGAGFSDATLSGGEAGPTREALPDSRPTPAPPPIADGVGPEATNSPYSFSATEPADSFGSADSSGVALRQDPQRLPPVSSTQPARSLSIEPSIPPTGGDPRESVSTVCPREGPELSEPSCPAPAPSADERGAGDVRPDKLPAVDVVGPAGEATGGSAAGAADLERERPAPQRLSSVRAAAEQRAWTLVARGFQLARRGALFSARADFIQALRLTSRTLDGEQGGQTHMRALAHGLRALDEAADFAPRGSNLEADLDLRGLILVHRTPVMKNTPAESLTPAVVLGAYLTYAQQQLAAAAGREPPGSMALYGLARISSALSASDPSRHQAAEQQAVCLHQAALLVRPDNAMAANELGVLLAHFGHDEAAAQAFRRSVEVAPSRVGWRNLAVACQRSGHAALAEQAQRQADRMVQQSGAGGTLGRPRKPVVEWLAPTRFARTGPIPAASPALPALARTQLPTAQRQTTPPAQATPRAIGWLPWHRHR